MANPFFTRLRRFSENPLVITFCIVSGGALGAYFPAAGKQIGFIGNIYLDLLRMIVLPFMLSAVIFSLSKLHRHADTAKQVGRIMACFTAFLVGATLIGLVTALVLKPGNGLSEATLVNFGKQVQQDSGTAVDTEITINGPVEVKKQASFSEMVLRLVPSNVFAALSGGDTVKVLVFSLLFGLAAARVPHHQTEAMSDALHTVYSACQALTRWFNLFLPLASFAMAAEQIAATGLGPLAMMVNFITVLGVGTLVALAICVFLLKARTGLPLGLVLRSQQESFFMALATRSSTACMPTMIATLTDRLKFDRAFVELLVPLGVSLLRLGPALYYVVATLFIANLYGRPLTFTEISLVFVISLLAALASGGMSSVLAVAQTSVVCGYLGLPFEAAFVLFVAVDPVCDMMRTALLVIGINAATAVISPRLEHGHQAREEDDADEPLSAQREAA